MMSVCVSVCVCVCVCVRLIRLVRKRRADGQRDRNRARVKKKKEKETTERTNEITRNSRHFQCPVKPARRVRMRERERERERARQSSLYQVPIAIVSLATFAVWPLLDGVGGRKQSTVGL